MIHSDSHSKRSDEGQAILEFIAVSVVLLVPVAWGMVGVAKVQSADHAMTNAARQAARAFVMSSSPALARARAHKAAEIASEPFDADPSLRIECRPSCLVPGGEVTVTARTTVSVPGPWSWRVPVSGRSTMPVDQWRA